MIASLHRKLVSLHEYCVDCLKETYALMRAGTIQAYHFEVEVFLSQIAALSLQQFVNHTMPKCIFTTACLIYAKQCLWYSQSSAIKLRCLSRRVNKSLASDGNASIACGRLPVPMKLPVLNGIRPRVAKFSHWRTGPNGEIWNYPRSCFEGWFLSLNVRTYDTSGLAISLGCARPCTHERNITTRLSRISSVLVAQWCGKTRNT